MVLQTLNVSKCGCVGVNLCACDLKKRGHDEAFQHAYKTLFLFYFYRT